ncbi:MAG TPA: enoyl-CoA hydratase/isomerase family protein, partial [Acidimicrobiia bacterium]|nr:enoyl-CoA hydratase/isomerase family protein [Acidimicrobiia bacterium]
MSTTAEVTTELYPETSVGVLTFSRGEHNFFDVALLESMAAAMERLAVDGCRAIVLRTGSKSFCAGMDVLDASSGSGGRHIYDVVPRLFAVDVPVVASVRGAAIGGGLGLAMAADFRVAAPEARFAANFARLGFSPGFALTATLPAVIGPHRAAELLYTGRRF